MFIQFVSGVLGALMATLFKLRYFDTCGVNESVESTQRSNKTYVSAFEVR